MLWTAFVNGIRYVALGENVGVLLETIEPVA
jgi:hypothetical protein